MDFLNFPSLIGIHPGDEQNPKIVLKMEKIGFPAKFAWKLKFQENRGKFTLKHWF